MADPPSAGDGDRLESARDRAYAFLAHKPRTKEEVRRRLRREDVEEFVIEDVLARLEERGYVDDAEYAGEYARQRSERGYGPYRVRHDLRERGVAEELIDRAIETVFDREELARTVRELAENRWDRLHREDDPRRRRKKVHDYLARRGFPYELISDSLREITD